VKKADERADAVRRGREAVEGLAVGAEATRLGGAGGGASGAGCRRAAFASACEAAGRRRQREMAAA